MRLLSRDKIICCVLLICQPTLVFATARQSDVSGRLNVLFIAIDDLRPLLGCYGDKIAITPNIDRLAERGIVFNHAYCQQAVCGPSRLSLMTGRRPDTTRVWDLSTHFREALPNVVTLPQHFRNHGYLTRSIGKIYHGGGRPSRDDLSWSVAAQYAEVRDPKLRYASADNLKGKGLKRSAAESVEVADNGYIDGIVCDSSRAALKELRKEEKPFFLAVGFRKPHLPFCAPKKYWDLYPREDIPLPVSKSHPKQAPELAVRSWKELEGYSDISSEEKITIEQMQELRHGYYACISYVDALIGRLFDELRKTKLEENTVVCLWGDHGYHLGEQGLWTKANNYELSTRVPLILSVPGQENPGSRTDALVELVDIYPTLVDACGLGAVRGLEGTSLMPLLGRPERPWKTAAFSQYPRSYKGHRHRGHGDIMGYAVRTKNYRYVQWQDWKSGKILARELYDQRLDPSEMHNIAGAEGQSGVLQRMEKIMTGGWREQLVGSGR
ncbi:MAG: sulfatase [Verrucomicrobiaceae bacterium]|nr:sulfatase [Verrucomicrobiaceae bacterium]